ncbi:lysyl oxidase family protein [Phaeodactylibacter luteus]|nr:lysyl oxidase family protein [Phaeodactylibacter luteus]
MKKVYFFLLALPLLGHYTLQAQEDCPQGERLLLVEILTDAYGYETAWSVSDPAGNVYGSSDFFAYENNALYQAEVCIPDSTCIAFNIEDSFGDGIFSPGYYMLVLDGDTIALGGQNFTDAIEESFNCQPGQKCNTAITVSEGQYIAEFDDTWYSFTPDSVGTYLISTCGLSDCNTKIWIYDTCNGITIAEDNQSTIFYNDDENDCAPQAVVEAYFDPEATYLIRIGDHEDACEGAISWELTYTGPVVGCTDPASCNFNPLASVDDGSCLPQGDPDCPAAPDLLIRQDILESSIYLTTINSTDPCLIEEGCLHGYGQRDIIRFTTHIANIGELDYFIGQPAFSNTQFTWDNCHNHFHYDGYAEYILFEEDGTELPIGFKNGFCVIDLGCTTGSPQYGCNNMGITAGCHDIYSSGLECQWIDITDVQDGRYTFVTRVNWDNAPDKLGRVERDTLNNWAQVCILLDRSSGALEISLDDNCDPYVDCTGTPYGGTAVDCNGECGGTALHGDLDFNGEQEISDAMEYVTNLFDDDLDALPCNDLNADGEITVYDASLLANCVNYGVAHAHDGSGAHDHCNFPAGLTNETDTTVLAIIGTNFEENYVDIGLYNNSARINAYQFEMSGLEIMSVESLVDPEEYPAAMYGAGQRVVGISYQDSTINKTNAIQPLCRVYFSQATADYICIEEATEVINYHQERTLTYLLNACVEYEAPVGLRNALREVPVSVAPNPFANETLLSFPNPNQEEFRLEILDAQGKIVQAIEGISGTQARVDGSQLPAGLYFFRLSSQTGMASGRLSVKR